LLERQLVEELRVLADDVRGPGAVIVEEFAEYSHEAV
jgi:hypothetical protein